jgi:hypothetical protein
MPLPALLAGAAPVTNDRHNADKKPPPTPPAAPASGSASGAGVGVSSQMPDLPLCAGVPPSLLPAPPPLPLPLLLPPAWLRGGGPSATGTESWLPGLDAGGDLRPSRLATLPWLPASVRELWLRPR